MRILFLIDSMTSGGKERRLTELMKRLSSYPDIEFELVVLSREIHYQEVLDLKIPIHHIIRNRKRDLAVFRKLYNICKTFNPDIIHCWDGMAAVYITPVCKILKIKLVNGMVVDTPVHYNIFCKWWLMSNLTFPFADLIVGNSQAGLKAYRAPEKKSVCIHNGMDLTRFEDMHSPEKLKKAILGEVPLSDLIVGMVAAFEDRKDYETLVKAAVLLTESDTNIIFVFVGDGVNLNKIQESILNPSRKRVIFLGKRSDVESIVSIFDIGVLLTNSKVHGEGISNSILEYMALGKPVIATKGGGTNEVVAEGINGYLINAGSTSGLVEKIELLKNNKQLRIELGENGKKLIHEKFDIAEMTRNYVKQYNILLNKN